MIKTVEQVEAELAAWEKSQEACFAAAAELHADAYQIHAQGLAMNDTIRNKRNELLVARGETA